MGCQAYRRFAQVAVNRRDRGANVVKLADMRGLLKSLLRSCREGLSLRIGRPVCWPVACCASVAVPVGAVICGGATRRTSSVRGDHQTHLLDR